MALSEAIKAMISFPVLLGVGVLYVVYQVVYRLFFHPLSRIPGPWYAAVSTHYEFYWDCIKSGHYMFKIEEMHKKYGPVVRINPWEVHINGPSFMDPLWGNNKLEKDPFFYGGFGTNTGVVSTVPADLHRLRRGAMAQFFSKANIAKLEPRVLARVKQLCKRIETHKAEGKNVNISNAYRCLATDIVTDYAVPKTRNFLDHPDFASVFNRVIRDTSGLTNWNRHISFLHQLMVNAPRSIVKFLDKDGMVLAMVDNQQDLYDQAKTVVDNQKTKTTPTVINAIFNHPSLPPQEKTITRIFDETTTVIGAGTETTGNTLANLTFYVINNPTINSTLKAELNAAAEQHNITPGSMLPCSVVGTLPYLQAIMKESLRIASGVCGRMPRRNMAATMSYTAPSGETYVFPPGTIMSMSIRDIHFNESIFKEPNEFNPDRWLTKDAEELAILEKHLVPFGKGVRQCIGLELAKQEILLVAANLFWKYDFDLFETTQWDVTTEHDFFAPFGPSESKGVRVTVK
ncbi:putative cytochrome P450 [Pleomassaria siparia CBS 279.74]|uniref:Putative cytochrome P450 n=1 Tax=Pleomassaria siparia CBS 279.74 TaxID=1314801 RepID=A0A6G1JTH0_9PLEO|nr:putative cytochrome P450 [Pleomassaria siparia CBS 279.74]